MAEGTLTKAAVVEQVANGADLTKKRAEVIVKTVFGSFRLRHRELRSGVSQE